MNKPTQFPDHRIRLLFALTSVSLTGLVLTGWFVVQGKLQTDHAWWLQIGLSVLIAGLVFAMIQCGKRCLVSPMDDIADWASRIRQGDFSARLSNNTFGMDSLQADINRLTDWLHSLVENNDQQLRDKTEKLQRQSAALQSLYDLAANVNQQTNADELIKLGIHSLQQVVDTNCVIATLYDSAGKPIVQTQIGDNPKPVSSDPDNSVIHIPLQFKDRVHGKFEVSLQHPARELPDELTQALYSMGRSIGLAIEKSEQDKESARLFRMEERTRIANELHDSLAQTVASLRFQVRILDDLMHQEEEAAIWEQMERVEGMLDEAHSELRSLIGYFRAPIDPRGLMPALRTIVSRFKTETGIPIFFHNQWGDLEIPSEWERQIVLIIQEALTNIRKHSDADTVRILFRIRNNGHYLVLIEDDGKGFTDQAPSDHPGKHIGLSVMRERAAEFGAEIVFESEPGEGTRILLSFSYPFESESLEENT